MYSRTNYKYTVLVRPFGGNFGQKRGEIILKKDPISIFGVTILTENYPGLPKMPPMAPTSTVWLYSVPVYMIWGHFRPFWVEKGKR